jgi:hypothetical protein
MGRLADYWAGKKITQRSPYTMPGDLLLTSGQPGVQFPEATFMNNVDKPFEIHRVIPRVTAVDVNNVPLFPQPDQDLLSGLLRVQVTDLGKNQKLTKNPSLVTILTKGSSERTWEFADPYYLIRSESIQVVCDALTFPAIPDLAALRVEWAFQGFLIVVAPASDVR